MGIGEGPRPQTAAVHFLKEKTNNSKILLFQYIDNTNYNNNNNHTQSKDERERRDAHTLFTPYFV